MSTQVLAPTAAAGLIHDYRDKIATINSVNERFLTMLRSNPSADNLPEEDHHLSVSDDGEVSVTAFGFQATAKQRLVRSDESILMEYVFTVPNGDDEVEVLRFYVTATGMLASTPARDHQIGQINGPLVVGHIVAEIALKVLDGVLFRPRQRA